MRKGQLPVAGRHDPLAGWDLPMINFLRWVGAIGTLIFGVVTVCFFIAPPHWPSVGFLFVTLLCGLSGRVTTQRLKSSN